jgi:hypothetical protein
MSGIGSGSGRRCNICHLMMFILLVVPPTALLSSTAHALSSINYSSKNAALLNRLQTVQAELLLSVGRIPGTAMPPEWAASGARLGLAVEVEFTNERCPYEMSKETLLRGDALMGTNLMTVEPLNEPSFVSSKGREAVRVLPGAYGCQVQGAEATAESKPRWINDGSHILQFIAIYWTGGDVCNDELEHPSSQNT